MTQFFRLINQTTPNLYEIRQQNPDVGIPDQIEDLSTLGYEPYKFAAAPAPSDTHVVEQDGYEKVNGFWQEKYKLVPLSTQELNASLAKAKAQKNDYINAERLRLNQTSFTYLGKEIACDALSRGDIDATNGYIAMFGGFHASWAGGWKCIDNSYVPLSTMDEWRAFYKAMVDQGLINFARSQALKAQLAQATSHEQVVAIKW